jgi:hypothetical protein
MNALLWWPLFWAQLVTEAFSPRKNLSRSNAELKTVKEA